MSKLKQKKLGKIEKRNLEKRSYVKYDWIHIRTDLQDYLEKTEVPILREFFYKFKVSEKSFEKQIEHGDEKLALIRDFLIAKKQAQLERGTLSGQLNPAMAIFSLKQMGWRDNVDSRVDTRIIIEWQIPKNERNQSNNTVLSAPDSRAQLIGDTQ